MKKLYLRILWSWQIFLEYIQSNFFDNPIGDKEHVLLRAKDFKYPNKEEFIKFHNRCPKLEIFGFEHNHPLALIVNNRIPMNEASRLSIIGILKNILHDTGSYPGWSRHCLL